MVIRGNPRGNPRQLSHYLLSRGENEAIRILEVDGRLEADAAMLHQAIFTMGVTAELTKTDKGLFHAQVNPAPGEDKHMTDERWQQAADILAQRLKLQDQRRVIVLHTKKGRTHAHIVWERYDKERGKMVSDGFSRIGMDHARQDMERIFGQKPTPRRNKHRPELKENLTRIWNETRTGKEFLNAIHNEGYWIGAGAGRHPFMVIDEHARSHDLPRQIKSARLKDVRERLRGEKLLTEKEALAKARAAMDAREDRGDTQRERGQRATQQTASAFRQTSDTITDPNPHQQRQRNREKFAEYMDSQPEITNDQRPDAKQRQRQAAQNFKVNREEVFERQQEGKEQKMKESTEHIDPRRAAFRKRMEEFDHQQRENEKNQQHEHD